MTGQLATVFGASGFVGRHVVRELAKRGWRVRAAVRSPHTAHHLKPMGDVGQIQLFPADILFRPAVERAVEGADAVINLVGVLYQKGRYSFRNAHVVGASNVAELAAKAGARHFVQMSAIGADPESDALYAQTKGEGEAAVRAAFPGASILRPSIIFGPRDQFFNKFAAMATIAPALPLIGMGKTRFQPVYVDDVADAVAACLEQPQAAGRVFELGGPNVYSFKELLEYTLKIIERKRLLAPVPFPVANLLGFAGEAAGKAPIMEPFLTRDQVKLLKSDNICGLADGDVGSLGDLGLQPRALEAIVPTYLERFRKYGEFEPSRVG